MNAANPWLIPRNWLAQNAIKAAEAGDLNVLERLMAAIRQPYAEQAEYADLAGRRRTGRATSRAARRCRAAHNPIYKTHTHRMPKG